MTAAGQNRLCAILAAMPIPWSRRGVDRVLQTPIFTLERHHLLTAQEEAHAFHILRCSDWCNILPITADNQVVMVKQYRYGTDEETLELPGGVIDPEDPNPLDGARRELLEETGYEATDIVCTGIIQPNPAMQTNRCHSFLARNVRKMQEPALDAGEDIEVVTVALEEIPDRVARGEIQHALVVVAFAYAFGLGTKVR